MIDRIVGPHLAAEIRHGRLQYLIAGDMVMLGSLT